MNIFEYQTIRHSFGLNRAQAGNLVNMSSLCISRLEEARINPPDGYKQLWIELSQLRHEYISQRVESIPRAAFKGSEREWVAHQSAVGYLLSINLASNATESYNPMFSELNQPFRR